MENEISGGFFYDEEMIENDKKVFEAIIQAYGEGKNMSEVFDRIEDVYMARRIILMILENRKEIIKLEKENYENHTRIYKLIVELASLQKEQSAKE